jgi:HSP20 family protein
VPPRIDRHQGGTAGIGPILALSKQTRTNEDVMVERSHTAGWWPTVYEPIKRAGEKIADWFAPRSDASASDASYRINMELPGVTADDIEVSVQDGTVIVSGEKRFANEEQGENYFFSEREYGAFQRSFRLPPDAKVGDIGADFRNGVLTVTIPKSTPQAEESRKVTIRTS